jgi:cytochrome c553
MEYKNGKRHNDIYSRMRLIAKQLTDAEIKALSEYYQQLR